MSIDIKRRMRHIWIAVGIMLLLYAVVRCIFFLLPYPELETFRARQYSTRFYDRNGTLVYVLPLEDGLRREWVSLADMPAPLPDIFIYAEDRRFYSHGGVDVISLFRAAVQNIFTGKTVSGASTITMQLARLVSPRAERNIGSKLLEMVSAVRIEHILSKDQILELYLNSVPFGFGTEGVATASKTFFSCDLAQLDTVRMAALSVIPRRPQLYNPRTNPEENYRAAADIASAFGVESDENEWKKQTAVSGPFIYPHEMPHFILYVLRQFETENRTVPPDLFLSADAGLCRFIENRLSSCLNRYADARISNGSALVLDNRTGEILAWTGSADFFDTEKGSQIDGVLVRNQPGSAMKPFLYALALESGIKPVSILPDIPTDFGSDRIYVPLNFNDRYNGPVRMRIALASSLNVPAVYLLERVGTEANIRFLVNLGFDSLRGNAEHAGLGLALGNGEVTLLELVRAFSSFPSDGAVRGISYLRVARDDISGVPVQEKKQVFSQDTARILCDMLSDRNARVLGFGFSKVMDTPFPSIFKTGTSNQFQDIVALGAVPSWTAGVWFGNFSGETVIGQTGSSIPAGVVSDILSLLQKGREPDTFRTPESWNKEPVCSLSGMKPGKYCPSSVFEYVFSGEERQTCTWHCSDGGRPAVRYPAEYQAWLAGGNKSGSIDTGDVPLRIVSPADGAVYFYDPGLDQSLQQFRADIIGGRENSVSVYIDGNFFGVKERPFTVWIPVTPGEHTVSVMCGNEVSSVSFSVK